MFILTTYGIIKAVSLDVCISSFYFIFSVLSTFTSFLFLLYQYLSLSITIYFSQSIYLYLPTLYIFRSAFLSVFICLSHCILSCTYISNLPTLSLFLTLSLALSLFLSSSLPLTLSFALPFYLFIFVSCSLSLSISLYLFLLFPHFSYFSYFPPHRNFHFCDFLFIFLWLSPLSTFFLLSSSLLSFCPYSCLPSSLHLKPSIYHSSSLYFSPCLSRLLAPSLYFLISPLSFSLNIFRFNSLLLAISISPLSSFFLSIFLQVSIFQSSSLSILILYLQYICVFYHSLLILLSLERLFISVMNHISLCRAAVTLLHCIDSPFKNWNSVHSYDSVAYFEVKAKL